MVLDEFDLGSLWFLFYVCILDVLDKSLCVLSGFYLVFFALVQVSRCSGWYFHSRYSRCSKFSRCLI